MRDSEVLIQVSRASKRFCRDLKRSLWYGIQDTMGDLIGRDSSEQGLRAGEFWALDDVSFQLRRGECLGLVGRNGAGKTTLLKMLNGLIKPDYGRIEMRGRVGALIALGAGFNPILTGRENIYVNGAVLGLSKKEIDSKLDEIISFAEIERFIDTPVQSYSSGMQVRLGFAVATALDPDVLLLDEILAVGDAAFRAKCYNRIARVRRHAALIFVSHNIEQIAQLCSSVLLLDAGQSMYFGPSEKGIELYNDMLRLNDATEVSREPIISAASAGLIHCDDDVTQEGCFRLSLAVNLDSAIEAADLRVVMWSSDGAAAFDSYTRSQGRVLLLNQGRNIVECEIAPLNLKSGRYSVSIALINRADNTHIYWADRIKTVNVEGPSVGSALYTPKCVACVR